MRFVIRDPKKAIDGISLLNGRAPDECQLSPGRHITQGGLINATELPGATACFSGVL